jgi:hypothetical protein
MGTETFAELEEPEQFENPDLRLPEGLTWEQLWEARNLAIGHGDDVGEVASDQFVPPPGMFYQLPTAYNPHQNGQATINGATTVNGGHGMDGGLNRSGHYELPSIFLNGHNNPSSQRTVIPPGNGGPTSGSIYATLPPLANAQLVNTSGLSSNGMELDFGEYLRFDDGIDIEEDNVNGTLKPNGQM